MRITGVSPCAYSRSNVKFANKNNATNFGKFLDKESKDAMYAKARQVMSNKDQVELYIGSLEQSEILEIKMGADGKVKGRVTVEDEPDYKTLCPLRYYGEEGYLEDMESGIAPLTGLPLLLYSVEEHYKKLHSGSTDTNDERETDECCSIPTIQDRYAGYSSYAEMRAVEDAYGIRLTP